MAEVWIDGVKYVPARAQTASCGMESSEIWIHGVRYIPGTDIQPINSRAIKIALLEKFWGDCRNDSDRELHDRWDDLYIKVVEKSAEDTWTIDELLDRIAEHESA